MYVKYVKIIKNNNNKCFKKGYGEECLWGRERKQRAVIAPDTVTSQKEMSKGTPNNSNILESQREGQQRASMLMSDELMLMS